MAVANSTGTARHWHEDGLSLGEFLEIIWRGKWTFLVCLLLCLGAMAAWVVGATRQYRAEVLTLSAEEGSAAAAGLSGPLGGLASLAGLRSAESDDTVEALALLESRGFLEDFIRSSGIGDQLCPTDPEATNGLCHAQVAGRVIRVRRSDSSPLIRIAVTWHDREKVAVLANDLVARLNSLLREKELERSRSNQKFLQEQYQRLEAVELRNAVSSLLEQEMKREMAALGRTDFVLRVIDSAHVPHPAAYVFPRPLLMMAVAFILGLLLATGLVVLGASWRGRST